MSHELFTDLFVEQQEIVAGGLSAKHFLYAVSSWGLKGGLFAEEFCSLTVPL